MNRKIVNNYMKEAPMLAQNRSLHERLMTFAPPHHFPAYVATTVERDENGAYLKIPLISPLAAAYKHQACKYCGSFECPPKRMCDEERDFWLVDSKK